MMGVAKKKVALDILKGVCTEVENPEEAQVIVGALEEVLDAPGSLSAPEINIKKKLAIVRTPDFSIDLVNPIILEREDQIISFRETCPSFPIEFVNCLRYNKIVIRNGFSKKPLTFTGKSAIIVQHEIDHLEGKVLFDRAIKMAVVREGGEIKHRDYCPCGSKRRFGSCCEMKKTV